MLGTQELPHQGCLLQLAPLGVETIDQSGSQDKGDQKGDNSHAAEIRWLKIGYFSLFPDVVIPQNGIVRVFLSSHFCIGKNNVLFKLVQVVQVDE